MLDYEKNGPMHFDFFGNPRIPLAEMRRKKRVMVERKLENFFFDVDDIDESGEEPGPKDTAAAT